MKLSQVLIAVLLSFSAPLDPASSRVATAQDAANSTETYGGWMVRCKREKEANLCEMLQTLATGTEKDRKIVAQVAIGRLPNAKTPRAVLQVPMGVDLTRPPMLVIGETAEYTGRYFICTGRFCRAEIELPANVVSEIDKAKKASMRFTLLGKNVVVLITIDGMAKAFKQALGKAN
jgi:invasion protein IalB